MPKRKNQSSRSSGKYRAQNALELAGKELDRNKYFDNGSSEDSDYSNRKGILMVSEGDVEDGQEIFEDEELDSDEALGPDDDYDVMSSKFSRTLYDKKRFRRKNQESRKNSDDDYTSIDEADLLPLSEIWDKEGSEDDNGSNSAVEEYEGGRLELQNDNETDDNNYGSHDTDYASESFDDSSSKEDPFDEMPDDDDDNVTLNTVASSLLRDGGGKEEYKRLGGHGTGNENEFALPSVATSVGGDGGAKLTLTDMIDVIDDKEAAAKATLIQGDSSTLSVPLPQRIQQRHERKVAYAISKDEMNRWKDIVQENRRAEHLDLSSRSHSSTDGPSSSAFIRSVGQPQTHLEQQVEKILQESHLTDPVENSTFKDLSIAHMSIEDMKKRTRETRLMRELMFREERKAKRLKKIKSKAYHRIKKKEMLRNRESAGIDQEFDEEADVARAKERMTLKHRSNSKWAKDMVKHGMTNDAETREEVEEMLRQGERLKSKILDYNSDEEDNRNVSDIEREEAEANMSREKVDKSGIMGMGFMKAAEAREKEENRRMIESLKVAESSGGLDEKKANEKMENVGLNQGRRIYKSIPSSENIKKEQKIKSGHEANSVKQMKGDDGRVEIRQEEAESSQREDHTEAKLEHINPWLADDQDGNCAVKHSSKVSVIDKNSTKAVKDLYKLEKKKGIRNPKNIDADEDSLLDNDDRHHLKLQADEVSPHFMFKQQEIIAEAFAGDDVVDNFDAEKRKMVDEEDDKEEDVTLLGWGQWIGAGYKPKKSKKFVKITKGAASKNKRKDKNLPNVIINEKLNKKNLKYQSSAVPFPFENREQYERSLRMPLGSEWTSSSSHQKMIKPRILTKPSEVIDPLKAPFK